MNKRQLEGHIELWIAAVALVDRNELDVQDQEVPGVYSVMVRDNVPSETQAAIALDVFHGTIPVSTLEDFGFFVFEPETGLVLDEDPEHEAYSSSELGQGCLRMAMYPNEVFEVQVDAVCEAGKSASTLGTVVVAAQHEASARQKAREILWDRSLTGAGCQPRYTSKSLT